MSSPPRHRAFQRWGLFCLAVGIGFIGTGLLLAASLRELLPWAPGLIYGWAANVFLLATPLAIAWQLAGAYRDQIAWDMEVGRRLLPHVGLPVAIIAALVFSGESIAGGAWEALLLIVAGLGLIACGGWSCRTDPEDPDA